MKKTVLTATIAACILLAALSLPVAFLCQSLDRHSTAIEQATKEFAEMKAEVQTFNQKVASIEEDLANVDRVIEGMAALTYGVTRLTTTVEKMPEKMKEGMGLGSLFGSGK